jgi:hypothetical protein
LIDWASVADAKRARYDAPHGELDERAVVRLGNAAYAAGLSLLMVGSPAAAEWLLRAAERWRASWDLGPGIDSWGRPAGVLKAALLAADMRAVDDLAAWTLELGSTHAASPIGRYAAVLALLATRKFEEAAALAGPLRGRDDFPHDVAEALAAIAAGDEARLGPAADSVVHSFETRRDHLEDVAVADTALVLQALARSRGLRCELPASRVLPSSSRSRPARSPDETRS